MKSWRHIWRKRRRTDAIPKKHAGRSAGPRGIARPAVTSGCCRGSTRFAPTSGSAGVRFSRTASRRRPPSCRSACPWARASPRFASWMLCCSGRSPSLTPSVCSSSCAWARTYTAFRPRTTAANTRSSFACAIPSAIAPTCWRFSPRALSTSSTAAARTPKRPIASSSRARCSACSDCGRRLAAS